MRVFAFVAMILPCVAHAQNIEVDVELFLAVDVSRSMSVEELEIQRQGYADALASAEVLEAVQNGLIGRVAVTYVEWAGEYAQRVVVPWQILATAADAKQISAQIRSTDNIGMRRTSIAGALNYAVEDFDDNGFDGLRRVIDVSGDGPNNQGPPVVPARDRALALGITINGLPLMTTDALSNIWGIPDLDEYYQNCVIGGPGSFVVPVFAWDQFAAAVKQKLVLEIAALPRFVVPAQYAQPTEYNCMIGEEMWRENRPYLVIP